MRRKNLAAGIAVALLTVGALAGSSRASSTKSGFVKTADGVKIHYLEAGTPRTVGTFQVGGTLPLVAMTNGQVSVSDLRSQPSILFIPGWTMPAWI